MYIKNTAGQHIPFLLIAPDGTAVEAATVSVKICIDGAQQADATGVVTEIGLGQYDFAPSQADMNGDNIGFLMLAAGAVPVHFTISPESVSLGAALNSVSRQVVSGNLLKVDQWDGALGEYVAYSVELPTTASMTLGVYSSFGLTLQTVPGDRIGINGSSTTLGVINNIGWTKDTGWIDKVSGDAVYLNISATALEPIPAGVLTLSIETRLGLMLYEFDVPEISGGGTHLLGADGLLYRESFGTIAPVQFSSSLSLTAPVNLAPLEAGIAEANNTLNKLWNVLVASSRTLFDNGIIRTITMAEGTWTYTYATKVRSWLGV